MGTLQCVFLFIFLEKLMFKGCLMLAAVVFLADFTHLVPNAQEAKQKQ